MRLILLAAGWLVGLVLGSVVSLPPVLAALGLTAAVAAAGTFRGRWRLMLAFLFLLGAAAGLMRQGFHEPSTDALAPFRGQTAVVTGVVSGTPDSLNGAVRFRFRTREVVAGGKRDPVVALMQVTALVPEELALKRWSPTGYQPGDELALTGSLEAPQPIDAFDLPGYLARQDIHSVMAFPKAQFVGEGGEGRFARAVWTLRERLGQGLGRTIPEPEASLAQALTIGVRQSLPADVSEDFRRSGTLHILSISGLNVSIVLGIVLVLCRVLPWQARALTFGLPLTTVWLYVILAGAPVSAQRAAIMASVYLVAQLLGRQRHGLEVLLLAAAAISFVQPQALFQVSFQLSFLAMAGIILVAVPLIQRLPDWTWTGGPVLRGALALVLLSAAPSLATLPAIAFYFGRVSLMSVPASILTTLAMVPAIAGSFATAVAAAISPSLGWLVGGVAWPFLHWTIAATHVTAAPAMSSVPLEVSGRQAMGLYALMGAGAWGVWRWLPRLRKPRAPAQPALRSLTGMGRYSLLVVALGAAAGTVWVEALQPNRRTTLDVRLLEVSQGQVLLMETPAGQRVLMDGGADSRELRLALDRQLGYADRRIDVVAITKASGPGATPFALERYRAGAVLHPEGAPLFDEWARQQGSKTAFEAMAKGARLELGQGLIVEVLNPPVRPFAGTYSDADNNSLVLRVEYGQVSFLLMGDIRAIGQQHLLEHKAPLRSTVLIAPPGLPEPSRAFLEAVAPSSIHHGGPLLLRTDGRQLWQVR